MKISFIIPLYNNLSATKAMLESLAATIDSDCSHEIILVDDYSQDGTREWLSSARLPNTVLILNPRNLGYAKSNNNGARRANGDYLFLLNNDLLLQAGWLKPMLDVLEHGDKRTGIVGNIQTKVSDGTIDHAGVRLNLDAQFEHIQTVCAGTKNAIESFAVTGACVALRRADFESVKGFDENFVNGCEDIDLCLKLRAQNRKVEVALKSQVQHHVSLSRSSVMLRDINNSRILFQKWRSEIKNELTKAWYIDLSVRQPRISLTDNLRSKKHTAAILAAEASICREEYHWARTIDSENLNKNARLSTSTQAGLSRITPEAKRTEGFVITVAGLYSANTLRVHAQLNPYAQNLQDGRIQINVNNITTHHAAISGRGGMNIELHRPFIVAGGLNTFYISMASPDATQRRIQMLPFQITMMAIDDIVLFKKDLMLKQAANIYDAPRH